MRESGADFGGTRTRVLELDGSGPPLLLLHGYSDSADTWRPLLRLLEERGRRAIAVDMRGFGQADPFDPGPLLPQLDAFVAALVQANAPSNGRGASPIIVGNSLGGVAALRALQNAELPLAGVVAVSPAGLGHQPWVDLLERDPFVHRILTSRVPLPMKTVRRGVAAAYGRLAIRDRSRADPGAAAAYASLYRTREDVARVITNARLVLGELHSCYELSSIERPVLMIWGDRDLMTPIRGSKRVLDAVPGAELVVLEGVGHCGQVEVPERVAELVCGFAPHEPSRRRRRPPGRRAAA